MFNNPRSLRRLGLLFMPLIWGCPNAGDGLFINILNGDAGENTVGDVTQGRADSGLPGHPLPDTDLVRARVRNESRISADVTLRFLEDDLVVHLAFARVPPDTMTTILSPRPAAAVSLSGVDGVGRALHAATLLYGVDFDESRPAEYLIRDGAVVDTGDGDPDSNYPAPRITLLEPADDIEVTLGSTLMARWSDEGGGPGTVVRLFLRAEGTAASATGLVPVGPAIGAALDGIHDELTFIVQGVEPGVYRVAATIQDGARSQTALSSGRVRVLPITGNQPPTLLITAPRTLVSLSRDQLLRIAWEDFDPDDNATIRFHLESSQSTGIDVGRFPIGPPIAEDPDGPMNDSLMVSVAHVLPGLYDLVGTIDDGSSVGTDRRERVVRILPDPVNDPPRLTLLEPATDIDVEIGGAFLVRWVDGDDDDDARISLLLDPDLSGTGLTGNEILLISGISEDALTDRVVLGIPDGVPLGTYRLIGVITDGVVEVVTAAPGRIRLLQKSTDSGNDNGGSGNGNGNGGGNGGGDGNGNDNGNDNDGPGDTDESPWPEIVIEHPLDPATPERDARLVMLVRVVESPPYVPDRAMLTNEPYGGRTSINVPTDDWTLDEWGALTLYIDPALVPTNVRPRTFDLILEWDVESSTLRAVSPEPVTIP